jgi:hypothetical protein
MTPDECEQMAILCERIATEKDHQKSRRWCSNSPICWMVKSAAFDENSLMVMELLNFVWDGPKRHERHSSGLRRREWASVFWRQRG